MAITACREVWRGETWSDSKDGSREYLMIFELLSDDPEESPVAVRSFPGLPAQWSAYPDDGAAVCVDRQGRREDKTRLLWWVECQFRWSPEEEEDDEDPLNMEPAIRWTSNRVLVAAIKDKDGDAIVNSAGDFFDPPPERPRTRWVANIQFNATEIPPNIRQYADAVNDDAITIDGEPVAAQRAQVVGLDIGEVQYHGEAQTPYRSITMAVEVRDDDDESFDLQLLDQGLRRNFGGTPVDIWIAPDPDVAEAEWQRASAPVLLNGSGDVLDDPGPDTAVFITYDTVELRDLTIFPGIE